MTGFDPRSPIDLHTHSNVSDGTQSPAAVVRSAAEAGLGTIALTDHDTWEGWDAAGAAAKSRGLSFIPGVEFSTQVDGASVHVLGYLVDRQHEELGTTMRNVRESRLTRAERMVEAIGMDFPISWSEVLAESEDGATIGRPHIADALVRRGIVADRNEAFAGILHWQGGYYQPHHAPHPVAAIRLIKEAGGVSVLAHPGSRGRGGLRDGVFERLVEAGLDGVEIYHRENDEFNRVLLHDLAREWDLIVTGSSDYHGLGKPNRLGENTTEPEQLQRIIDRGSGTAPQFAERSISPPQ